MGVMHQPITDGVGEGRIADALVPVAHGELPGQERGPGPMAIVHDLEEVSSFPVRQGRESPIIHHEQIRPGEFCQEGRIAPIPAGQYWGTLHPDDL